MCAVAIPTVDQERYLHALAASEPDVPPAGGLPRFVKAEANLLRLPLFALHTKGLKSLDGIECSGRITRDGQTHAFTFRATRNTATVYPGPLARSAHLAFLSLVTDTGLPLDGPLSWTWRDLCRRMGVTYGGQMVRHLKESITATAALLLQSEYAIYSRPENTLLCTRQEALHLYDRVAFVGSPLPDGGIADRNYLWLSDWYRQNLNALFTAPLDYELWRHLDVRSPIASRLYEFLLPNFYGGAPVLRINYENLVRFLPARAERYRSTARQQLEPALHLLAAAQVIGRADWADSKDGLAQLHLYRGARLAATGARRPSILPPAGEEFAEAIQVKELRNSKPSEWAVVAEFYRLWSGDVQHRPTAKELAQAQGFLAQHGTAKARGLIPLLVKNLKARWPEAKTFGAAAAYLPEASLDYDREQHRAEREREERLRAEQERHHVAEQVKQRAALKLLWERLPEAEREPVRQAVLATQPPVLRRHPEVLERLCLDELGRRHRTA